MNINDIKALAGIGEKTQRDIENDFLNQNLNNQQHIDIPLSPMEQLFKKLNTVEQPPISNVINRLNSQFNLEASIIL